MIQQTDMIGLHFFRQAVHERIELYQARYRDRYWGVMSDQNINEFIAGSKAGIFSDIDALRAKLVGEDISQELKIQVYKVVHYFWAELMERLKGLGDEDYVPSYKD